MYWLLHLPNQLNFNSRNASIWLQAESYIGAIIKQHTYCVLQSIVALEHHKNKSHFHCIPVSKSYLTQLDAKLAICIINIHTVEGVNLWKAAAGKHQQQFPNRDKVGFAVTWCTLSSPRNSRCPFKRADHHLQIQTGIYIHAVERRGSVMMCVLLRDRNIK
jgi:hypothetical protein